MGRVARKKSEGEIKSHQQHLLMAPSEIEAIDDWAFSHRIRSRGDAIRRLCQIGLAFDTAATDIGVAAAVTANNRSMNAEIVTRLDGSFSAQPDIDARLDNIEQMLALLVSKAGP